jgi:predicted nucleic acid-binding protein
VIHLDSSFLIDLQRETHAERPGDAFEFLESLDDAEILAVSAHVVCELRVGVELSRKPLKETEALDHLMSGLRVVYPDERFPLIYARLLAAIQRSGGAIAAMDLLIAATALMDDAPLVTRNVRDFSRVPGLRVLSY